MLRIMESALTSATDRAVGPASLPTGLEARVKAAKKTIVSSGMRIGRVGVMISTLGAVLAVAAWKMQTPVSGLGIAVGVGALLFGLIPFSIGWGLSKAGSPFLRALSDSSTVRALFMDASQLAGGRRSLSLLLTDGTRQTLALKSIEAFEVVDLVGVLSPSSERGEREQAQRVLAQLMTA
jgi:hypothetical protein